MSRHPSPATYKRWKEELTSLARSPRSTHTHAVTVPETTFLAFVTGEEAAAKLAKGLARTYTPKTTVPGGKRRVKAAPVVQPIEEWRAAHAA